MKKLLIILLSTFSLTVFAQTAPSWYNSDMRNMEYPYSQFFIGFVEGQRAGSESIEDMTKRLKDAARVDAVSSIRTRVQNTTINQSLSQTLRTMDGTFRQSVREFSSSTKTTVDIEIPGLQVEVWQNPQNGNVAAFAYVKKATLIRQVEKNITVGLTKIETSLDQIDQMVANAQKKQARDLAQKSLQQFLEIDEAQKLLAAVDENADEESLQLQETRTLQHRLTGLIANLKNGINVCLYCNATDINGNRYGALIGEIKGVLSPLGVSFTDNATDADWIVNIDASARPYNTTTTGQYTSYFTYVDADISVTKVATNQVVFEDRFSEKGRHTISYMDAARDGYKHISLRISKIITNQIQQ